ncbi:MAG: glycosyltransferase family 9 protein [Puniceicoccales bacterium]|jgi:ADP-heptose:LPS heptosyltransferase|nr:glycosyltransferase family 9 protein [Puniceicoccales bacterium]
MRILVIKPSSLGDIIHGMVVVAELKAQRPDCIIDWVVSRCFFDIVYQSQIASRVIIYERYGNIRSIFRLISEIRQEIYDYVFDMQGLARSGLMTFFAKSSHKIGRRDSHELSFLAYSQRINYPGPVHAIDILKEFLTVIGCVPKVSGLVKALENVDSPSAKAFLKREILPHPLMCIFPESRCPKKEWSFFTPLVQAILERDQHVAVVLLGNRPDPAEHRFSFPLCFDLRAKTSLSDVVFLIRNAQLVIANDSGPLHISAALGRNTLGLFTQTNPLRFGPYPLHSPTNRVLLLKNMPTEVSLIKQLALDVLHNSFLD